MKSFGKVITAIVTPFTHDNHIDFIALKKLADKQVEAGIKSIVVLGTTGEATTLTKDERKDIIRFFIQNYSGRLKLIVGIGGNNTQYVLDTIKEYDSISGISAYLAITPYYNKATQKGLITHFNMVANSSKRPIILYNVPSRTGVNLEPTTVKTLSENKNIIGVKEASGNILQVAEILRITKQFLVYSGDDGLTLSTLGFGGDGVISVASNIIPATMLELCKTKSKNLALKLLPIFKSLFCEVNPIPVKYALSKLGLCENALRLPLTAIEDEHKKLVDAELNNFASFENDEAKLVREGLFID